MGTAPETKMVQWMVAAPLVLLHAWDTLKKKHGRIPTVLEIIAQFFDNRHPLRTILGDLIGLYLLQKLYRLVQLLKMTSIKEVGNSVGRHALRLGMRLPIVSGVIEAEFTKNRTNILAEYGKDDPAREQTTVLPFEGMNGDMVIAKMDKLQQGEIDAWINGGVSGAVYLGDPEHSKCLDEASNLFSLTNPLHPDIWPSVMKFEAEVCAMASTMLTEGDDSEFICQLNGEPSEVCAAITSGGTESILMSAKAHRQWGARSKWISEPEVIACVTAHAAIDKACDILGMRLVHVPMDPTTGKMDVKATKNAISANTILIYSSAPNYPNGTIDDIDVLSELAYANKVGLHVDCCLGGFVLPFARKLRPEETPVFDFSLRGVTTISCDTHKYGCATKGTSIVLFRNKQLRHHMYFSVPDWTGGLYATPSTAGSRPGSLIAATWASMMRLGEAGYLENTRKILEAKDKLISVVRQAPGLKVVGEPSSMVVGYTSEVYDIYAFSDMLGEKGYHWANCQKPACAHLCITMRHVDVIDDICAKIIEVATYCNTHASEMPLSSTAAVYGTTSKVPGSIAGEFLNIYQDIILST